MSEETQINVRLAKKEDISFIKKTWLYSFYNGNNEMKKVDKDTFMPEYDRIITDILVNPNVLTRIACLADDPDTIIGFSVVEENQEDTALHYVYVKKMWRGNQIHLKILPHKIDCHTHTTRQFEAIKPKSIKFNPFLIGKTHVR